MDVKELASDKKKADREKLAKDAIAAKRTDWALERQRQTATGKGFFTCRKCHGRNTTYFQMQTRGADEPMTNFITCLDCKNQWKS